MANFFNLITNLALKLVPEEGIVRNLAKCVYARLYAAKSNDIIHRVITNDEQLKLDEAIKIGFVGDLILLRDMVEAGCKNGVYDYRSMFEPMRNYFSECDLMTGVLEGPLSGEILGYTTANYEDGRDLYCGYPDGFLYAIKDAGIDLVTVANNPLFDKGRAGLERTISQLETNAVSYVGYGNKARTLITVRNLKIAVLAFNFAFNGKRESFFFDKGNKDLPHLIRPQNSKYYKTCLSKVKEDFEWAKSQNPNCILVYPHVGEQFSHIPDKNQLHWFKIFRSLGADIILGCHSHATQPLRFEGNCLSLYCPGNYVNNYFPHDGDASAMVEVYLDQITGKPFAAAVVPILAYGQRNKLLCAEPMSELADNPNLSWHDWFRLNGAHKTVTSSMIGTAIPIDQSQKRFIIWNDNSYKRLPYERRINITLKSATKVFEKVSSIVFIGDSISEGTKNGGYGWFEPLMATISGKNVRAYAKGSATSRTILDQFGTSIKDTKADIFCVAIGCNDIRYRDEAICAMTGKEYGNNVNKLISLIRTNNTESTVILVAPWWSDDVFDKYCNVDGQTKHKLYKTYTDALKSVADDNGCMFVNPNPQIWNRIRLGCQKQYLVDWIHPNAADGIRLFSEAFIDELSKLQ